MRNKYLVPFLLLAAVSILGVFYSPAPATLAEGITLPDLDTGDIAWMLTASGLVLLMTPGLSFFYGGMVSKKNIISTMLQSFIAMGIITVIWVVIGFSLAFGTSIGGFIGDPRTFFMFNNVIDGRWPLAQTIPLLLFALFQLKFAIITPALITGSFAERVRFSAYLLFMCLWSVLIYCPLAHWTWHPDGFLFKLGVLDFAGGTVVHMSAGVAALAGAMILGRRTTFDDSKQFAGPANIPFVIIGTGLLWFGWFGFNAGSAVGANALAVSAFATTIVASATAMMSWIFFDAVRGKKASAIGACVGAVVGLVAVTPAAGFITVPQALCVGFVSAIVSNLAVRAKNKSNLDDTLDVFPCHGIGGISGMILTGIFAKDVGLFYGQTQTFLYHLLAIVIVIVFTFIGSYLIYKLTAMIVPLRVSVEEEKDGLDFTQHGETYKLKKPVVEPVSVN